MKINIIHILINIGAFVTGILVLLLFIGFILPVLMGFFQNFNPMNTGVGDEGPAPGYYWTMINGGGWADYTVRHDSYFINASQPDTLKFIKTDNPGCAHAPFSYYFEFLDQNNTMHEAQINILQSGDEIGGPWYDGVFVDNWHKR